MSEAERVTVILAAIENARRVLTWAVINGIPEISIAGLAAGEIAKVIACKDAYDRAVRS